MVQVFPPKLPPHEHLVLTIVYTQKRKKKIIGSWLQSDIWDCISKEILLENLNSLVEAKVNVFLTDRQWMIIDFFMGSL